MVRLPAASVGRLFQECLPCLLFKKGIGDTGYLPVPERWEIMRREPEVLGGGAENPSCRLR